MSKVTLHKLSFIVVSLATLSSFGFSTIANAQAASTSNTKTNSTKTAAQIKALQVAGDAAIAKRLTTLSGLNADIAASTKLSASNRGYLTSEVNDEVTGLTQLKTKLDADTTVATAKADKNTVVSGYRVYLLVVPKVKLIALSDKILQTDGELNFALPFLQAAAQQSGDSTMVAKANDMATKIEAAEAIAQPIEAKVLTLQPSDYNTDHTVLQGDYTQLKTAQADNKAAIADAKAIAKAFDL